MVVINVACHFACHIRCHRPSEYCTLMNGHYDRCVGKCTACAIMRDSIFCRCFWSVPRDMSFVLGCGHRYVDMKRFVIKRTVCVAGMETILLRARTCMHVHNVVHTCAHRPYAVANLQIYICRCLHTYLYRKSCRKIFLRSLKSHMHVRLHAWRNMHACIEEHAYIAVHLTQKLSWTFIHTCNMHTHAHCPCSCTAFLCNQSYECRHIFIHVSIMRMDGRMTGRPGGQAG